MLEKIYLSTMLSHFSNFQLLNATIKQKENNGNINLNNNNKNSNNNSNNNHFPDDNFLVKNV